MPHKVKTVRFTDNGRDQSLDGSAWQAWGGSSVTISLGEPGDESTWLLCGPEFVKNVHTAAGEYLAKRAHAAW